ncbi:hypothetical protein DSO57_1013840 [Entomophthora muscae]|uniref:Uncharacterized protein n=1 Tax=Entomophthora muscae TaxID=34485 RepID=A0ACC2T6I0_9FUNG|nr:hypothetical protein DSO57_1013840 [Entomophthora muscae]
MNLFTFFAVLKAYLGFGGHQLNYNQYGSMLGKIKNMYYEEQPQLAFSYTQLWPLLGPSKRIMSIAIYTFKKMGVTPVGDLESRECRQDGVDRQHPSKDLGMYVKMSEITGKVQYKGIYCYVLGGEEQHQHGPGVHLRRVKLRWLLVEVLVGRFVVRPMLVRVLVAPIPETGCENSRED